MPRRQWTDDELARMKAALEGGVYVSMLAPRFRCCTSTVLDLARRYGWHIAAGGPRKTIFKPMRRARSKPKFFKPERPAFEPVESGCPVRKLEGAEFQYWKAIYEARDRAERAKVHA